MIRNILLLVLMLVPSITNAQLESQLNFSGQNAEVLKAEKKVQIVTQVPVEVPSMCSRQVPAGQERVCRDVPRSRQECSWIPASQRCWNESTRVCRSVPRTRQECSTSPGRRVCTDRPSREVCTDRPSRQVCTERPTREVCTTRPDGRRHCTQVGGGTHCTTVGGGRECTQVGGGQSCHEVPGERHCRTVSYNEQECHDVSNPRCETVPGRNDCRTVSYSEEVCGMETRYVTETYACTRTEMQNRTSEKTIKAETNVQIITNGLVEEFPVGISIKETDPKFSAFAIETKLLKEPKVFVVLKKKEVKIASSTEKEILLKANVILEVMTKEMLPISLPVSIIGASIEEATKKMVIVFEGAVSSQGAIDMLITHKSLFSSTKTIAELKGDYPSAQVEVGVVENKAALSIDLKDAIKNELKKKNMKLKLSLSSVLNLQGELMNAAKPETSKLYEGTFVELK